MSTARAESFAIVANGFADGPAQALRDYLVARGARVTAVSHPLTPEDGGRHVVATYAGGSLVSRRSVSLPLRPPGSFLLDPVVPLHPPRVDVWFGFNPLACARGLLARSVRRARRVVLWSVDFVPDRFGPGALQTRVYDRLDRLCCLRADARVELSCVAQKARDRRHGLAQTDTPTYIVPMGAWLDRTPKTDEDGFRARGVVFLGHLVRRQGVDALIDAVAILKSRAIEVSVDIVGTGPLEQDLRLQARTLGVNDVVRFHGFVADHRDLERLLASASIAAAPYRPGEGTFTVYADPGKLKAYLAAGLPVVLTDVPPNAARLAREAGSEIVPFDAVAIADAVSRTLDSPQSWQLRRKDALAYSTQFDWPLLFDDVFSRLGLDVAGAV